MRRPVLLLSLVWLALALLSPREALAHGTPPVAFLTPAGPGNVVERGTPYTVSWYDPDLYADDLMTLRLRPSPPPPYITFWPVEQIEGEAVAPAVSMADPANALEISTEALAPGHWFFWFDVIDTTNTAKYVAPAGVLTVVEPGEPPPPSIWFDQPWTSTGTDGETYEAIYSTFPTEGVTVDLSGSLNDLEGLALQPLATGLPGGSGVSQTVSLHCVGDGAYGLFATVRDAGGREGSVFATGRISWRRPDGGALPADCPDAPPDGGGGAAGEAGDGGGEGCGCSGAGGRPGGALPAGLSGSLGLLAALVALRARRRALDPSRSAAGRPGSWPRSASGRQGAGVSSAALAAAPPGVEPPLRAAAAPELSMTRTSTLRLAVALAAATGCFLVHCDDGPGPEASGGAGGEVVLPEVIYDGRASDEALTRVWDRIDAAEADAAKSPTLTIPADGATVPAAPASDLAWELAIAAAPTVPRRAAPTLPGFPRLAFGPAVARAHLPPVSGWIYLAQITPTGGAPIRLFTTNTRWTPDAATWAAIVAGGGASIRIFDTYLNENVVEEGPYVMPTPATFTVTP